MIWYDYRTELGFKTTKTDMYFYVIKLQKSKTYNTVGTVPIFNRKIDTPSGLLTFLAWYGQFDKKKYGGV